MKTIPKNYLHNLIGLLSVLLILVLSSTSSQAQYVGYGGGGFGGYGGMSPYGGGMSPYGGFGGPGGGAQGPGAVLVRYGEKVYDAVFGDLVDYKVYFIQVPADTIGVHYYDDGTHGDEVGYDGIPSNITIIRDTYIGPFTIKYKKQLKKALEVATEMGTHEFFSLVVTAESPDSSVVKDSNFQNQYSDVLEAMRTQLAQYEGYNEDKYIKAVDPSLFESLEGFGGVSGGLGGSGMLPDLPPPPGLPQPNVRFGLPETLTGEAGLGGGDVLQRANTSQGQSPPPQGRSFNPIQRARDARAQVEGQQGDKP